MVKGVLDSTSTSSDFYNVFDNIVATNPHLEKTITEVRNESNLFLVKVLRFYAHRDMAFVRELGTGKEYYCHLTHEMLSYEVSLNCMCDGNVQTGDKYGTYVVPYSNIYGIVANVRFKGTTDEKCLLACLNYDDNNELKSNVRNGEIKLVSGDSTLSLTRERINLMTPQLFINGLPYNEPKLENYYDKSEISTTLSLLKEDTNVKLAELNDKIEHLDIGELSGLIEEIGERIEALENLDLDNYYTKTQTDNIFSPKTHTHSQYATTNNLTNYIQKSATTGLVKNNGTIDTTHYVATSDSRLSDARTPLPHNHNNLSNDGKIGNASGKIIVTGTGGVLEASDSIDTSMISDFPSTMTPSSHTQDSSTITNENYYVNLQSGGTQDEINSAIDTQIGYLMGIAFTGVDVINELNIALEHINTDYVNYDGRDGRLGGSG